MLDFEQCFSNTKTPKNLIGDTIIISILLKKESEVRG